ncbi:SIMPL domain-containing protein [Tolypothrix bouteillei VB521301_2]|nr:SIMPL domain-containing protein [Tolypothrix bouteillei VB521301]
MTFSSRLQFKYRKSFFILFLTFGLSGLVACGTTSYETRNLASLPRTLVVSGRGMVSTPKTTSRVRLGVEVQDITSTKVQQTTAQRSSTVVAFLKVNQDVKKLATTGISLNPTYSYKDNQQRIVGYKGSNIVSFEIAPEKLGTLLDEAIKAGATRIDGVTLVATDEAIASAQKKAISLASEDARSQAEAALGALSLKQQEIVSVQINGSRPSPMYQTANFSSMDTVAIAKTPDTPVVAGEQSVEASVTLQIRY